MFNIDEIIVRLKYIEGVETDSELSEKLGITPQNINMWKKRNTIPYELLFEYCLDKNISIDWLTTGKTLEHSLKYAANTVSEPPATYNDPRDKIIQTLTEENRRLNEALDAIQSITKKSHNKC